MKASLGFVKNDLEAAGLLALGLTAQKFGSRPSSLIGLLDDAVALDFDNAAAMRLQQWEDDRTAAMFGGGDNQPAEVRFEA